jgi:hypothetical protein
MPGLQTVLSKLNHHFGRDGIKKMVKHRAKFGTGKPLAAGIVVTPDHALHKFYSNYVNSMPGSMQEAMRAVIHHSLGTKPATPITFSWAPGYDYEMSVWHAPDTSATRGGVTVMVKSRYPGDKHPLEGEPGSSFAARRLMVGARARLKARAKARARAKGKTKT